MCIQWPEGAIEAYEHAYKLEHNNVALAGKIGRVLVSTHDYKRAVHYYLQAHEAHPDDLRLSHDLAKLLVKLERFEAASQVRRLVMSLARTQLLCNALEDVQTAELRKMMLNVQSLLLLGDAS